MKKQIIFLALLISMSSGFSARAAEKETIYKWTVETNFNEQDYAIIRLYDQEMKLVHQITLNGYSLDIRKKKDRKFIEKLINKFKTEEARLLKKATK